MGSMNFGLFPMLQRFKEFKHPWERSYLEGTKDLVFKNTFADIEFVLKEGTSNGTRFEFECYDISHLNNLAHFRDRGRETTVKYIDPSYAIRSVPACPSDSVYCWNLARNVVHAAMAGNTAMLIGRWHGRFVHLPMALATRERRHVDVEGDLWMSVIEATGQPRALA